MDCLNNAGIQAVADGEASSELRQHVAACARCTERVRERERQIADLAGTLHADIDIPPRLRRRIDAALAAGHASGATRIRANGASGRRHRAFWSGTLAVAATLLAILFIPPMLSGPTTVSASEILAESANRLAAPVASGVEVLEYELTVDGAPRELMPDHPDGIYRIKQLIDHDRPGRFRFTSYTPDGQLLSSIAEDPVNGRRVTLLQLDDRRYRFEFTLPANRPLSLPELERIHMQASIGMMQAGGNQHLQELQTASGTVYRIEVPRISTDKLSGVWDLSEAQALIDADDYRVLELSVKGAFLKQPYSVSFKLIARTVKAHGEIDASEFDVPQDSAALTLHGEGTAVPLRDTLVLALRELARTRQQQ